MKGMFAKFVNSFLFIIFINEISCLKEVTLDIQPNIVEYGGSITLRCTYNLQGEPLYTVKYYRGTHEFYRYTPKELPSTKTFTYNGVNVDSQSSNEHQVVLRDVGFSLSGKFSCEVTTDAPNFSTATVSEEMLVVVLPTNSPSLSTDKSFYDIGDVLSASCTSPSSRPASKLTFILNNIEVCQTCYRNKTQVGELFESRLFMTLPLFESHFNNGRLTLKCVAKIGDFYQQETEIIFDNSKDPVPEKVTAENKTFTNDYRQVTMFSIIAAIVCVLL
ncbi:uncharacterized protein LOC130446476 isoform X1 [Diorhabda sublineata]|uniref:uncharacterized protein LOC130446476 isoform X1 n=1 Tax=Diorhabda sublineata TaxID=1163346 RepID=UPI0024E0A123|nr:uncharacterized protein LOC130446476 isoform X1 [Diorhabda sublineata]